MRIFYWVIGALATAVFLVAVIATLANQVNRRKNKRGKTGGGPTPEESGRKKLDWTSWTYSIEVIVTLTAVFILVTIFAPALWQWLQSQKIFWLAVIVLPVLSAIAAKYKWVWSLAIIVAVIGLMATDWRDFPSNPTDWRLSAEEVKKAAEQRETTRAALAARGVTSIGPRIISAKPDSFDEEVTISGQKGMDFHSEGCIEFRVTITNFGKSRVIEPKPRYCPGEETPHIKYPPLGQATLAPRSLTGSEVRVFFWEPK